MLSAPNVGWDCIHLFQKTLSESTANGNCRTEIARPKGTVVSISMSSLRGAKLGSLRTFALIVCAQPFCAGNATAICHASLRLTGPEDKHGVENTGEKNFRPSLLLWIIGDPYFFNHESLTLLTIYKI